MSRVKGLVVEDERKRATAIQVDIQAGILIRCELPRCKA